MFTLIVHHLSHCRFLLSIGTDHPDLVPYILDFTMSVSLLTPERYGKAHTLYITHAQRKLLMQRPVEELLSLAQVH